MIELTDQQAAALGDQKQPACVVDPRTGEVYVLVRKDVYDLARTAVGGGPGRVWDDTADDGLILSAQ
ncbi:MAG: hypothetical protein K2P78_10610 [Gemmataceae bacterium]|nr:hypothetical protein [Gemmataceae bacterium]